MIIVTGAGGFIGSNVLGHLLEQQKTVFYVDEYNILKRYFPKSFTVKGFQGVADKNALFDLEIMFKKTDAVIHLGAITDTLATDKEMLSTWNVEYSKKLYNLCSKYKIPFIYASSAATYGDGSQGFSDNTPADKLKPLNPYGESKNEFDKWISNKQDVFWAGLKFFNVYGINEDHKGRMASMIFHGYNQIKETKKIKLFKNGEHQRDFVYVKDICYLISWMLENHEHISSGIYNVGSGKAKTFNDLANALFTSMKVKPKIEYIDMPKDLTSTYQSFTEADMSKLKQAGYKQRFYTLEEGIHDYVNLKTK